MTERPIGGRAEAHGKSGFSARATVVRGWDTHSILVLSVVFTGAIPLAVSLGITAGLVAPLATWIRAALGFVVFAVTLVLLLLLLRFAGRTYWFRQWFIDRARGFFPPSDEVAKGR